jgi:hypothetical protein
MNNEAGDGSLASFLLEKNKGVIKMIEIHDDSTLRNGLFQCLRTILLLPPS